MKGIYQKAICGIVSVLVCVSLSGCTIGEYDVCHFYTDENGHQHFMMLGKHEASGSEEIENEPPENAGDSLPAIEPIEVWQESETPENIDDIQENDYDSNSIVGTSLKRGWTSSDNSILKGKNVSVKEDSTLFAIDLKQDKEVTISYDIALNDGEYQLVYIDSDGTEQILQDGKTIQSEEQILFTEGENTIAILSNNAIFEKIDIQIMGIEVSDFR